MNEIDRFLDDLDVQFFSNEDRQVVTSRRRQISSKFVSSRSASSASVSFRSVSSNDASNNALDSSASATSRSRFLSSSFSNTDELGINTLVLDSAVSTQTLQKRNEALEQHLYFRSRRDFFVNSLALLAKCFSSEFYDLKSYKEVMTNSQHSKNWKLAMDDEMQSHRDNEIWKLITSVLKGRKILIGKWIYRAKRGVDEAVIKYKAR